MLVCTVNTGFLRGKPEQRKMCLSLGFNPYCIYWFSFTCAAIVTYLNREVCTLCRSVSQRICCLLCELCSVYMVNVSHLWRLPICTGTTWRLLQERLSSVRVRISHTHSGNTPRRLWDKFRLFSWENLHEDRTAWRNISIYRVTANKSAKTRNISTFLVLFIKVCCQFHFLKIK